MSEGFPPRTGMKHLLFSGFLGLNNVSEPHNLLRDDMGRVELAEAVNFEINDDFSATVRPGRLTIRGGATHSLWSKGRFCFMVNNNDLVRMYENETFATVFPGIGTSRVSYALAMGKVYAVNGSVQMIISDTDVSGWVYTPIKQSVSDTRTFGFPSPFDLVLWHSSRIFVACDNVMYESELFSPGLFDVESYIQFTSKINDWISVRGGIYVSTEESLVFLPGPNISAFKEETHVRRAPIIPGTLTFVDKSRLSSDGGGDCVSWVDKDGGIFFADENGSIIDTHNRKIMTGVHNTGSSVYTNGKMIISMEE